MRTIYLTPDEASEFLRISMSKLYKMTALRQIPHFKCGKLLRFKEEDLIAFMEHGYNQVNVKVIPHLEYLRIPTLAA